jgi:Ca-activated chloride channel family protein
LGQDTPRFRAEVDQVVVYASVYTDEGTLVTGLEIEDFQIFENRIEQEIATFARTEVPSTIGIVLDSSGSMRSKMPLVEEALELFIDQTNSDNELFFVRFDDEVELEEDFTREFDDVRDAIGNVIVKGGTALYDAIYLSVDKAQEGSEPKKVTVVFTDGEDKDSYYTQEELIEKVREEEAQVFIVAFLDEDLDDDRGFFGVFKSQRNKVQEAITQVAEETGGKAFFPEHIDELATVFESIAYELKNQYRLSYRSSIQEENNEWRRIDVKIVDAKEKGLRVRARKGYYPSKDS